MIDKTINLKNFGSKRYGIIEVSSTIYEQLWRALKLDIIPLSIEYRVCRDTFRIDCFCELFRELEDNETLPFYEIILKRINNFITIEKIEEVKK